MWQINIAGSSKLRFYNLFKNSFAKESYLDLISNFKLRKVVTKFRCSDHSLQIEKGRHGNFNVKDRICKICDINVENEMHLLKFRYKYEDIRNQPFVPINQWLQII